MKNVAGYIKIMNFLFTNLSALFDTLMKDTPSQKKEKIRKILKRSPMGISFLGVVT